MLDVCSPRDGHRNWAMGPGPWDSMKDGDEATMLGDCMGSGVGGFC